MDKQMDKQICFYHSADFDGRCSAAIIRSKYPNCIMYGMDYDEDFPWEMLEKEDTIFMVDFSLEPFAKMETLAREYDLIWIDHHISAIDAFGNTKENHPANFKATVLDDEKAACELTWEYIYPEKKIPTVVSLLGRYDVWDLNYHPKVLPFQMGMKLYNSDPEGGFWKFLFSEKAENYIDVIASRGQTVLEYKEQDNKEYAEKYAFEVDFHGHVGIAVNRGLTNSQILDSVWNEEKHDIMLIFAWKRNQWKISIYTEHEHIDVSEIAKKYKGGGHKKAAGFYCKELPFNISEKLVEIK